MALPCCITSIGACTGSVIFIQQCAAIIKLVYCIFQMTWPFWRVTNHSDLAALHHALDLGYL